METNMTLGHKPANTIAEIEANKLAATTTFWNADLEKSVPNVLIFNTFWTVFGTRLWNRFKMPKFQISRSRHGIESNGLRRWTKEEKPPNIRTCGWNFLYKLKKNIFWSLWLIAMTVLESNLGLKFGWFHYNLIGIHLPDIHRKLRTACGDCVSYSPHEIECAYWVMVYWYPLGITW